MEEEEMKMKLQLKGRKNYCYWTLLGGAETNQIKSFDAFVRFFFFYA